MEPCIEKIGPLLYTLTIIFGKNRQIHYFSTRARESDKEKSGHDVDMIASMGKKALIITVPNPFKANHRIPFIVKRWKKKKKEEYDEKGVVIYYDTEGHRWIYRDDYIGRSLVCFDDKKSHYFDMNEPI